MCCEWPYHIVCKEAHQKFSPFWTIWKLQFVFIYDNIKDLDLLKSLFFCTGWRCWWRWCLSGFVNSKEDHSFSQVCFLRSIFYVIFIYVCCIVGRFSVHVFESDETSSTLLQCTWPLGMGPFYQQLQAAQYWHRERGHAWAGNIYKLLCIILFYFF